LLGPLVVAPGALAQNRWQRNHAYLWPVPMPEIALNPPPFNARGGTGRGWHMGCAGIDEPPRTRGDWGGAPHPPTRGNRTGSGCGARPAARGRPTRRSWRWRIKGWGAPSGGTPSGRSRSIPSRGAWRPERGIDARAWGAPCSMRPRGWRARWPWRGGQVMRNRGRCSLIVRPRWGMPRGMPCAVGMRRASANGHWWAGRGAAVRRRTWMQRSGRRWRRRRSRQGRRPSACGSTMQRRRGACPVAGGGRRRQAHRCAGAGAAWRSGWSACSSGGRVGACAGGWRTGVVGSAWGCARSPCPQEATASLCISMTRPNAGNCPESPLSTPACGGGSGGCMSARSTMAMSCPSLLLLRSDALATKRWKLWKALVLDHTDYWW